MKLFYPSSIKNKSVSSVRINKFLQLVKQAQINNKLCNVMLGKPTVKWETGSCGIIMSGWCLHEHISTSSQVNKAHSSHGFECFEYTISTVLSTLQRSQMQQHSYNAHLVFKAFVPHGHICTELNLLQNVQWYETCSCRASTLIHHCRKRHQIEK